MATPPDHPRSRLRLVLDEGVPIDVGRVFASHGHEVIPFDDATDRDTGVLKKRNLAQRALQQAQPDPALLPRADGP